MCLAEGAERTEDDLMNGEGETSLSMHIIASLSPSINIPANGWFVFNICDKRLSRFH